MDDPDVRTALYTFFGSMAVVMRSTFGSVLGDLMPYLFKSCQMSETEEPEGYNEDGEEEGNYRAEYGVCRIAARLPVRMYGIRRSAAHDLHHGLPPPVL